MFKAIDPGSSMGWASVDPSGNRRAGVADLHSLDEGGVYCRAEDFLKNWLQPGDDLAVEGMILPSNRQFKSRIVLFGIRAIILKVAFSRGIKVREYTVNEWRAHFLGVTQAPKIVKAHKGSSREWLKEKAIDEVKARGWGDVPEDAAEALGILDYHVTKRTGRPIERNRQRNLEIRG